MKLMPACASVAAYRESAVALCIAGQITISIRPDANKTCIYLCTHIHMHANIVYSASSLPDAVANKYLLHYTHLTNPRPRRWNIINKSPADTQTHTDSSSLPGKLIYCPVSAKQPRDEFVCVCVSAQAFAILHF